MSPDERSAETKSAELSEPICRLDALQQRSQVDFEIEFFERILSRNPNFVEVLALLGDLLAEKGWHRRALQIDQRLCEIRGWDPVVHYNLACSYALLQQPVTAVGALRHAIELGYDNWDQLASDPDLDTVRQTAAFQSLMKSVRATTPAEGD